MNEKRQERQADFVFSCRLAILSFLTYNLRWVIEVVKLLGKTIRQLSEELQLSKQAINQRISSIKDFRSKHTHKVKNHLEIDEQGVKMLANFDKQKRQDQQVNRQERQAENDKRLEKMATCRMVLIPVTPRIKTTSKKKIVLSIPTRSKRKYIKIKSIIVGGIFGEN